MLTARAAVEDRIDGLDAGADDYLAKPFDVGERFVELTRTEYALLELLLRNPASCAPSTAPPLRRPAPTTGRMVCVDIVTAMRRIARCPTRGLALASALLAGLLVAGCATATPGRPLSLPTSASQPASASSHVVVIVLENKEYGDVIGSRQAPYTNRLARRYGLATRSYGIRHPSLPNYLALTSGSTQGITSDCTDCQVSSRNIVDQMESAGVSWKAYLEDMPGPCFHGAFSGGYAKKHNPFAYYDDVAGNPARCRRMVPLTQLAADLRSASLPTYAWISPNLCNDSHDCNVRTGDRFLARTVPALLSALGPHGFLVVTYDEGVTGAGCCADAHGGHIATIVAGPDVRRGAREAQPVDHYGVLRTIEDALGVDHLSGAARARNGSLAALFTAHHTPTVVPGGP